MWKGSENCLPLSTFGNSLGHEHTALTGERGPRILSSELRFQF
jgi:hypothetical protein